MRRFLLLLFTIAAFSCSPVNKYKSTPAVLDWENDIQTFEKLDKSELYPSDAILFAGSSSIKLWNTLAEDIAPYPVIQRGYGGAKMSDLAVYIDRIVAPHPCRAIVVFIANDITGSNDDKTPEEVARLVKYTLKVIRKTHRDTPVFWLAVTPTPSRWTVWDKIRKVNQYIEEICESRSNTYFIRTDFAFLGEDGKPKSELFVEDMLHLNPNGYAIWTTLLKTELNKVLTDRK
jgi:hypothetical protein